ncbi:MAG: hypothetical protein WCG80_10210 [Spirochaetales bacterium]
MKGERKTVHVLAHTHWDREWYQTYEQFRRRLVFMLDELLDVLESKPDYRRFTLDGTMVLVEDYLEIRPENRERLAKLIREGRLLVGPWYTMPDENLVHGESLLRNLEFGLALARQWTDTPMLCGYLIDVFGHVAQLPQILKQVGISSALLYRGIGDYPKDLFDWKAPDGSTVLVAKLDAERSYSTWYFALRWPFDNKPATEAELQTRARALVEHLTASAATSQLLSMDGVDHIEVDPQFPELLQQVARLVPETEFIQSTFPEYEAAVRKLKPTLETLEGPLYQQGRRGINNHLLKNVLSSILPIKQANDACETLLLKWAEPFGAVTGLGGTQRNTAFLDRAWTLLFQNQTHDSICGCSITRVHRDNLFRFDQVLDLATDAVDDSLRRLAATVAPAEAGQQRYLVWNPLPEDRQAIVRIEILLPPGEALNPVIRDASGAELVWQALGVQRNREKTLIEFRRLPQAQFADAWELALPLTLVAGGYTTFTVENRANPAFVPGDFAWPVWHAPVRPQGSLATGPSTWSNGLYEVKLEPGLGLFVRPSGSTEPFSPLYHLEDEGDVGDGWVWRKPRLDETVRDQVTSVSVAADGPLCLQVRVVHRLLVPAGIEALEDSRTKELLPLEVVVTVSLYRGEALVDLTAEFDNACVGHRLRLGFVLPGKPSRLATTTPFALTDWPLESGTPLDAQEAPSSVVPNQGLVVVATPAGSVSLANRGLYETEIVDRTLYVTLLRSFEREVGRGRTGDLSRLLGHHRVELAWAHDAKTLSNTELVVRAEAWKAGVKTSLIPAAHGPAVKGPAEQSYLRIEKGRAVLSAWKTHPEGGWLVRLVNLEATPQAVTLKTAPGLVPHNTVTLPGGGFVTLHLRPVRS